MRGGHLNEPHKRGGVGGRLLRRHPGLARPPLPHDLVRGRHQVPRQRRQLGLVLQPGARSQPGRVLRVSMTAEPESQTENKTCSTGTIWKIVSLTMM
eukprot:7887668-Pyramimonas_sp.AAC.1